MMRFRGYSGIQVDQVAYRVLEKFHPEVLDGDAGLNVEKFLDESLEDACGLTFNVTESLPPGVLGCTDGKCLRVSASLAEAKEKHDLYVSTLAHEAGHAFLHSKILKDAAHGQRFEEQEHQSIRLYREQGRLWENPEWQAWRFAGALLMPAEPLLKRIRAGQTVGRVASFYGVSQSFVMARLRALKAI
jgi:hypothetical protein